MKKYFFRLALFLAFGATFVAGTGAQTTNENGVVKSSGKKVAVIEEAVRVETPDGNICGTLLLPQAKSKVPVVLIISGSGPTDRDGNSPLLKGPNNSLKLLAEGLAANGIAALRYDKRGIGQTGKEMLLAAQKAKTVLREVDLRFDAYIDDAVLWGQKLRSDKRFSTVTIAGHSEGSLIGMIAARKLPADGFVSIAGAGRPAGQILLEQLKPQYTPELFKQTEEIINLLIAGQTPSSVPPQLYALFRPSIQPYMMSWLRYDPAKEIAALTAPVLIIQGTTDIQVSVADARLLAVANPKAKLFFVEGMNHILKQVSKDGEKQTASYGDPTLPVSPALINEISRFVNKAKK
jgi:pimeloyl-ACP methyl ester carboxylesterase